MFPLVSIVLPSGSDGQPSLCIRRYTRTFNIRDAQHACRHTPGKLLPHLLTLTTFLLNIRESCGYFLLHLRAITDSCRLGSGLSYVARTFLSCDTHGIRTSDKPVLCSLWREVTTKIWHDKLLTNVKRESLIIMLVKQGKRTVKFPIRSDTQNKLLRYICIKFNN